jgi:hypothetical protein
MVRHHPLSMGESMGLYLENKCKNNDDCILKNHPADSRPCQGHQEI